MHRSRRIPWKRSTEARAVTRTVPDGASTTHSSIADGHFYAAAVGFDWLEWLCNAKTTDKADSCLGQHMSPDSPS